MKNRWHFFSKINTQPDLVNAVISSGVSTGRTQHRKKLFIPWHTLLTLQAVLQACSPRNQLNWSTPRWGFSLFFPSVNSSPTAKMSILLRDIFVLQNTVPPGVLGYRNLHTYSSFSFPTPNSAHCNHKLSQNPSCHCSSKTQNNNLQWRGSYLKSQLYLSEFSCLYKLILASSIHHLLLRLTSWSDGGKKKKRFCLIILTATIQK